MEADSAAGLLLAGVDIGGTFTDVLLVDAASGAFWVGKTLTTPDDPARGVRAGLEDALAQVQSSRFNVQGEGDVRSPEGQARETATALERVVHGTTLVTNALIERKGDRTALVTTKGFRDAVEIAREHRYDMYDIFLDRPAPIAPRHLRFEVDERLLADGSEYRAVGAAEVRALAARLREARVQAVAVCLLHAYRNPAHERQVAEVLRTELPGVRIALSSDVAGEIREYERTSTTLANVYVQRVTEEYLDRIQAELASLGSPARLLVMLSSGGTATVETARRFPVRIVESGPAAGALAAAHAGQRAGRPNLLSFDMGGTTAKACLIESGRPFVTAELEVDRVYRFKRGSGLPIQAPSIEMIEIGAGGGSIARVDQFGLVKVGPESAGAQPGPACYGQGGLQPTVTDADLVLGYLDPEFFLGGRMKLDRAAAEAAIDQHVARPLGMSTLEAAWAIHHVVNESMAAAARVHAVERGKDVRAFPMFALGGAGPVHACRVASILGLREVICPFAAGVGSTVGFLVAPLAFDFTRSHYGVLTKVQRAKCKVQSEEAGGARRGAGFTELDWAAVDELFREMEDEGRQQLAQAGVPVEQVTASRTADMRLYGQAHQIAVPLPGGTLDEAQAPVVQAAFEWAYEALYKRRCPDVTVEAISWRVRVAGPVPELELRYEVPSPESKVQRSTAAGAEAAEKGRRMAYFPELGGVVQTPVYDRYRLQPGDRFVGPAVVEERESTVVVGPGAEAEVDEWMNLVVRVRK